MTAVKKLFYICSKALSQLWKSFTTTVLKLLPRMIYMTNQREMNKKLGRTVVGARRGEVKKINFVGLRSGKCLVNDYLC